MTAQQLQHVTSALANRYHVTQEIGRGGMATVYLAEDPRHRRQVAIKVFDSAVADVLGKDRFLREIELTAGLTHPHILPLYDSGVADGVLYYVMPYLPGRSLRQYLSEKGRLPLDEALRIVQSVADALAFAHRQGIVHRDIKPENVLLQEGHALVADFGIARAATASSDLALTQTGFVVGTLSYMSPEQAIGDSSIDGRSDIYSLACLLFELLTGSTPFTGEAAAVARRRLTEAAPRLSAVTPSVPAAIDQAVAKALAREPGERFATADAFAAALTAAPSAPAPDSSRSAQGLVVLPFRNLSPDPENEYFADGLTEEVSADLSAIRALRVISRISAMRFKGTDTGLRTIARELSVRYVLEGSVRRAGSSLRVTAQLVDAETDSQLWAEKYSGSLDDVFAIQEEISRKIVKALHLQLTESEEQVVAARPIANPAAHDCYLRAHHEIWQTTPDSLDRAQKLADSGLALIGENPLLLATRGLVSWYYINFSFRPEERYLDEAASFATRALDQDPDVFLGVFVRGLVRAMRGNVDAALHDFRRSYELKPGDISLMIEWSRYLFSAGREHRDGSWAVSDEMLQVDPLNPLAWGQRALWLCSAGRSAEARDATRRALQLAGHGNPANVFHAHSAATLGLQDEAIALFDEVASAETPHGQPTPHQSLSAFLSRALQRDEAGALAQVTPQLEQAAHWMEYLGWYMADGYALIGRRDEALRWIGKAVDRGFTNYPFLATRDPFLRPLHGDAEFDALMRQIERRWRAGGA